ncbi:unnamed protein product [Thlaspi arvense]|uniref:NB-ARC domain-containing protein n=1 Tax=Thlaspi arvense TaxID=13288 RepID=A0AAU9RT27_THLAR|nr:unnamed protein product [Thlaspi arvense]
MDIDNKNNGKANHCVYISFDNNDSLIFSFINYLKATFNRHGVYQLDDQRDRFAEKIRALVVVFSKNYTFSAPENLVNNLNKKDLVVVPVLRGGTVSSMLDQMTMWPQILLDSVVLPGHVYTEKQSEPEFMDAIARDVFEKLYPTEGIGIHKRLEEIENLLCEQPWGVRTLGIFGKPGIGKTTLATTVFNHMSGGYDEACLIKEFHTKYNGESLDPEYFSETPMEKFDLNSSDLEPSHRKKRVLVALDDVRNAREAKSFLGGFDKFGLGSLIIITSSNEQILKECEMDVVYELKGLDDEDALKLFTRSAFGKNVVEKNLLAWSMKEIECYDGNPRDIRSHASKTMVEMEPVLPDDVCEVIITNGHDVSCDIAKNTCVRISPYEEDDEPQEIKEFPSDPNDVLATRDTIMLTARDMYTEHEFRSYSRKNPGFGLYNRISKSLPTYRLDYNYVMRSLSEHLHRKHHVLLHGFASQLQKISQSFSNSRDHDLLEQHLQGLLILSGGCNIVKRCIDVVRKQRELNLKGLYGTREKRSRTTELLKIKLERDQANGMRQYISN